MPSSTSNYITTYHLSHLPSWAEIPLIMASGQFSNNPYKSMLHITSMTPFCCSEKGPFLLPVKLIYLPFITTPMVEVK